MAKQIKADTFKKIRTEPLEMCVMNDNFKDADKNVMRPELKYKMWVDYRPMLGLKSGQVLEGKIPSIIRKDNGNVCVVDGMEWVPYIVLTDEVAHVESGENTGHALFVLRPAPKENTAAGTSPPAKVKRTYFKLERQARSSAEAQLGMHSIVRVGKEFPSSRFFVEIE